MIEDILNGKIQESKLSTEDKKKISDYVMKNGAEQIQAMFIKLMNGGSITGDTTGTVGDINSNDCKNIPVTTTALTQYIFDYREQVIAEIIYPKRDEPNPKTIEFKSDDNNFSRLVYSIEDFSAPYQYFLIYSNIQYPDGNMAYSTTGDLFIKGFSFLNKCGLSYNRPFKIECGFDCSKTNLINSLRDNTNTGYIFSDVNFGGKPTALTSGSEVTIPDDSPIGSIHVPDGKIAYLYFKDNNATILRSSLPTFDKVCVLPASLLFGEPDLYFSIEITSEPVKKITLYDSITALTQGKNIDSLYTGIVKINFSYNKDGNLVDYIFENTEKFKKIYANRTGSNISNQYIYNGPEIKKLRIGFDYEHKFMNPDSTLDDTWIEITYIPTGVTVGDEVTYISNFGIESTKINTTQLTIKCGMGFYAKINANDYIKSKKIYCTDGINYTGNEIVLDPNDDISTLYKSYTIPQGASIKSFISNFPVIIFSLEDQNNFISTIGSSPNIDLMDRRSFSNRSFNIEVFTPSVIRVYESLEAIEGR